MTTNLNTPNFKQGKLSKSLGAFIIVLAAQAVFAQPVINSIYPPTLTERAGDHVAFVVSANGDAPLAYQWYQDGNLLANQTNASIVLTNIQTTNSGQYQVIVTDAESNQASNAATLNVSADALPLASTNLVVLRLGDGVQALSGATGNTIYLDQYTTNGIYVSTIQIPDNLPGQPYGVGTNKTVFGSQSVILPGAGSDAVNEGVLTLSGDQQNLVLAGYQLAYPFTAADVTAGGANFVRGIYGVNAHGFSSLLYTNFGLYSGGPHFIRSAWTSDETNFWTTGSAGSSGGVKYVNKTVATYANGSSIPTIASSLHGPQVVQAINGNLVFSDPQASAGSGLYATTNGLSQLPPSTGAANIAQLVLNEGGIPNDFAASPDENTIYIADGRAYVDNNTQAGGIERWDWDGSEYAFSYTLPTIGTNGAQNLTVYFPPEVSDWGVGAIGAVIYATPAIATNNALISVADNGSDSTSTVLVTAGPNQVLRGLRFGPVASDSISIFTQPSNQVVAVDNSVTFSVDAQAPLGVAITYQWQLNGTNIVGATNATLTLTDIQFSDAGSYSVIVSNSTTSVTSSAATLTVVPGEPQITIDAQPRTETVGDHLALSAQVFGSDPLSYQWFSNNVPILGATNSSLVFSNLQSADAASYYLSVTNIFGSTNSSTVALNVLPAPPFLDSNNLIVSRVGDGDQTLSLATGNTIYLDQFETNGTYVSSIQIPDQGLGNPYGFGAGTNASSSSILPPGSNPLIVAGAGSDAPYEALLTLSEDKASINFAGYVEAYPNNTSDVTDPGVRTSGGNAIFNWRGIGGVSAYGNYTLIYTNSGLYSGGRGIHSAVTLEGVNFWTTGLAQNNGVKFVNTLDSSYANGVSVPQVTSSGAGTRMVQVADNQVFFSDAGASPSGIYAVDGGAPILSALGLAGSTLVLNEGGSPVDFAASPDHRTVYISDDRAFAGDNVSAGGIQRWDSDDGINFNYSYTLSTGTNSVGAIGLTVYFPPEITSWGAGVNGAVLYATTAERPNNRLIRIVDDGIDSPAATIAYSGVNQTFQGVRFAPNTVAPGIYQNPTTTNAIAGQSVTFSVTPTGSTPFYYQWQLNGTNIVGATNAILTLNNLQTNAAGAYTVVVSNNVSSVTSSAGELTALPAPIFSSIQNLGSGQGIQLDFSGPAGFNYSIWTSTNLTQAPIQNTWTQLASGGTFSGGTDTYTDPNGGTNASQFYIITVP
ncbi:MAG TPA: immunoglobulin domain-containing protein [Verrucomicrobiae bacterium]|nr:immunoglobulin domain-containing protein [Verrucomicrobiae bacterium]